MKIGIVGFGFVGRAVYEGFKEGIGKENILVNDVKHPCSMDVPIHHLYDLVDECKFIFICVPTPTDIKTGKIDTSLVEGVVRDINNQTSLLPGNHKENIVIIKSTVVPGTCRRIQNCNKTVDIIFNPEFLTEKNYIEDFKNQKYIVLGSEGLVWRDVAKLYRDNGFQNIGATVCQWEEAEMVKYVTNCFLASKVALFNEFYRICRSSNIDYHCVKQIVALDKRIGQSHIEVPGHDGDFGFAGKCFPKDLLALINFSESRQHNPKILKQIWQSNLEFRSDRNWLDIPGAIE